MKTAETKYYAENVGKHLAKIAISKFISDWASKRTPAKKGKTAQERFAFFDTSVIVAIDSEGNKTINGHQIADFWRHIDEQSAKYILQNKLYLVYGLCSWAELWEAYKQRKP